MEYAFKICTQWFPSVPPALRGDTANEPRNDGLATGHMKRLFICFELSGRPRSSGVNGYAKTPPTICTKNLNRSERSKSGRSHRILQNHDLGEGRPFFPLPTFNIHQPGLRSRFTILSVSLISSAYRNFARSVRRTPRISSHQVWSTFDRTLHWGIAKAGHHPPTILSRPRPRVHIGCRLLSGCAVRAEHTVVSL
jgi:hypothetical protein